MDMRQLVGRNVRRFRIKKKLTQEQLAEFSGLSQQYLSGLEHGKRNPTIVTVLELAQALRVSHMDLLAPDEEFTSPDRRRPIGGPAASRAPFVYSPEDFALVAEELRVPIDSVMVHAPSFEEAALWIRLGERRPDRPPPSKVRKELGKIVTAARRLLEHLGVSDVQDAADGPDDEEVRNWLSDASPGGEDSVLADMEKIGLLVEALDAREAAYRLRRAAVKAASDPFYRKIVPPGNIGDDILNQWIGTMMSLFTRITGKPPGTSVGRTGRPNEGVASGPLIRFLMAAGAPVGLDQSEDALRRRVRVIQKPDANQN